MKIRMVPKTHKRKKTLEELLSADPLLGRPIPSGVLAPGGPDPSPGGGLRIEADKASQVVRKLASLGEGLGPQERGASEDDEVFVLEIDNKSRTVAASLRSGLPHTPVIVERCGEDPQQLELVQGKLEGMTTLHNAVDQSLAAVVEGRQVLADTQRELQGKLKAAAKSALKHHLTPEVRRQILAHLQEIEAKEQQHKAPKEQAQKEAQKARESVEADLEAAERKADLMQTWTDLRSDKPVSEEAVAEALSTLEELGEDPAGDDRRISDR